MPKISQLPSLSNTPTPADVVAVVNSGATRKTTWEQVRGAGGAFNNLPPGGTGAYPLLLADFPQEYGTLSLLGTRFTGVGGASVVSVPNGVRNGGRLRLHTLGAVKLTDFFTPSPLPWVTSADTDSTILREDGQPPRLTTTQRDALPMSVKVEGLTIYNLTTHTLQTWNGTTWV